MPKTKDLSEYRVKQEVATGECAKCSKTAVLFVVNPRGLGCHWCAACGATGGDVMPETKRDETCCGYANHATFQVVANLQNTNLHILKAAQRGARWEQGAAILRCYWTKHAAEFSDQPDVDLVDWQNVAEALLPDEAPPVERVRFGDVEASHGGEKSVQVYFDGAPAGVLVQMSTGGDWLPDMLLLIGTKAGNPQNECLEDAQDMVRSMLGA